MPKIKTKNSAIKPIKIIKILTTKPSKRVIMLPIKTSKYLCASNPRPYDSTYLRHGEKSVLISWGKEK